MDSLSWTALTLLFLATGFVFWGLMSPTHCLPSWTHKHDKLWHVLAFSALAILAQGICTAASPWVTWLVLSCTGLASEWMQEKWAPGRLFSWGDALSNAIGAALGIAIAVPIWEMARNY